MAKTLLIKKGCVAAQKANVGTPAAAPVRRAKGNADVSRPRGDEGSAHARRLPAPRVRDHGRPTGGVVFDRAVRALRSWQAQIGAGIEVVPDGAWVEQDETVILLIRAAGFWATAPCRVVYVVEEPWAFRVRLRHPSRAPRKRRSRLHHQLRPGRRGRVSRGVLLALRRRTCTVGSTDYTPHPEARHSPLPDRPP